MGDCKVCYEDVVDLYAWTLYNKRGDGLSRTQPHRRRYGA